MIQDQVGLGTGNTRLYALKSTGDPGAVALDNSIFLWRFKVGVLLTELLPVVGEGVTGAPVVAKVQCGSNSADEKVGVIADVGLAYLLGPDGKSCLGQDSGKDRALASDFAAGAGKYDTPAIAAVGHPSFGQVDAAGGPSFIAPVAGLLRALDAAVNEYQGGQDMLAAWNTSSGQFHPGYPSPVNDLEFLAGPATADIDGLPGEEVVGGTASLDLNAINAAGAPATAAWPKFTGDWMVTVPAIGSFGADETATGTHQTVIAETRAGTVFAYDTDAPACSPASWPRFHHDNANSGLYERDAVSPGKPTSVTATATEISFAAPGDDLLCGKAKSYEAVTSDAPIAPDFSGATSIPAPAGGAAPGTVQKLAIPATAGRFVALRAVDEQGNVGRAVVLDRARGGIVLPSGNGGNGGNGNGGGSGATKCKDRKRPRTVVRRGGVKAGRKGIRIRGRSRDSGCKGSKVKRVNVSVARLLRGHRCRFLTKRGRLTHVRRCQRPVRLHPRKLGRWTLSIRHRLRAGHYQVSARAVDAAGNTEKPGKSNRVRFRIR
jgi:hypothetical protein